MLHCDLLTQLNFWLHWTSALACPHSPATVSSWPQHLCTIARQEDFSWLTNLSFKSKCTFLRAFFSPQLNILFPVCLVVTVIFSSMSLRHCAIKRIFLCPPGPLSYSLLSPPPLSASHFSNCRKEISSFLFTSIHLHPNPVPRIFLHPCHIEKCSCEDEYENLQCYWKFGGATCYLRYCGLRFLSMLVKNLKD